MYPSMDSDLYYSLINSQVLLCQLNSQTKQSATYSVDDWLVIDIDNLGIVWLSTLKYNTIKIVKQ